MRNSKYRSWIGPMLIAWLLAFPIVTLLPLLTIKVPFLARKDMSLFAVVVELGRLDLPLCLVVLVFGIVLPVLKMALSAFLWYTSPPYRHNLMRKLTILGKLSMLDIFLIAMIVVGFKGVGIGRIEIRFGAYIFAASVILALGLSLLLEEVTRTEKEHGKPLPQ